MLFVFVLFACFFFFTQKTAYEVRISVWSSDVCSSDLIGVEVDILERPPARHGPLAEADARRLERRGLGALKAENPLLAVADGEHRAHPVVLGAQPRAKFRRPRQADRPFPGIGLLPLVDPDRKNAGEETSGPGRLDHGGRR